MSASTSCSRGRSWFRVAVGVLITVVWLQPFGVPVLGHHTATGLSVAAPKCGWTEGESLRDRRNLSEFCQRWMPAHLRIPGAAASAERLVIEASPELASAIRDDSRSTGAVLHSWLGRWRAISGYKFAAIVLERNHVEIAKIYSTMSGDVVSIR
jgi:hypothetical protein